MPDPAGRFMTLPSELVCFLLVDWLELKEFVLVDSAICNFEYRHVLLDTVYPLCVLHAEPTVHHGKAAMLWISKRRLRANFLMVYDSTVDTAECRQFLENSRKFVKRIMVQSEKESNVAELLEILTACPNMHSLYVWTFQFKCSDEVLKQSGLTLSRLQSISVYCSTNASIGTTIAINAVSAASNRIKRAELIYAEVHVLQQLKEIGTFDCLQALSIKLSLNLSDANLIGLLRKTPHLVHLSLCRCQNLTDETGVFLAQHATNLQTVDISYCYLSNATMLALATRCAGTLHALNISECDYIDATGLRAVLEKCTKLRVLYADAVIIPWTLSFDKSLLQNLIVLVIDTYSVELIRDLFNNLPYLCGSLQYVSLPSCAEHIDFSAYTTQNMPFLRTINISIILQYVTGMYPTLDALQVLRPTLQILFGHVHNYFDVMELPL